MKHIKEAKQMKHKEAKQMKHINRKSPIFSAILITLLILFTFFFTNTALAADPSLVGLWHFDEGSGTTVADSSGNNNTLTLVDGPVWTTGKVGGALSFDGVDDYVFTPMTPPPGDTSIELWVKGFLSGEAIYAFSDNVPPSGAEDRMIWLSPDGTFHWYVYSGIQAEIISTTPINNGQWHYIVATINSSEGNSIWVDGVKENTDPRGTIGYNGYTTPKFSIAAMCGYSNHYGSGIVDEVAIYNRSLSADEIKAHYEAGIGPNTPAGSNVRVKLDGTTVFFSQVNSSGNTTITSTSDAPAPLPGIFGLAGTYYDISTTAGYSGTIEVSLPYDDTGLTQAQEQALKLQQYDNGNWVDITTSVDTANNIITGVAPHLSYFAVTKLLDTIPPTVTITSPQAKTYFNTQRTLTIGCTVQDNMDPLPAITNAMLDGDFLDMQNNPNIDLTQIALGQHMLTIEATDASGNVGQDTVIFEVQMAPLSSFMIKNLQISFKPETREHRARSDRIAIAGKLDLPSPYTKTDINSDVTVMLEVGSSSGTDTVLANAHKKRWEYKRKKFEVPADTNLDIKRLKIKWAGKEGAMDTFNIEGYMDAENDNSGNVTLTLVMPLKAGGDLSGTQTVTCKTSKRSWEYNAK